MCSQISREACYLCKRGTHLGDREATGAVLLSLLAVPRIYPKSPLLLLAVAARVGAYPKSRLSLLELGHSPPSLCRFATQGLLPLRWRWDAASPRPVCVWLCEDV